MGNSTRLVMFFAVISGFRGSNGLVDEQDKSEWSISTARDIAEHTANLTWKFKSTKDVLSVTIYKDLEFVASFLLSSSVIIPNNKYQLRITSTNSETCIKLSIQQVDKSDTGVYRCNLELLNTHRDITLNIAEFMPRNNPVTSTIGHTVALVWEIGTQKYNHQISRLQFTRNGGNLMQIEALGEWTTDGSFKADEHCRLHMDLSKTTDNEGQVQRIVLKIKESLLEDFNRKYFCQIFLKDNMSLTSEVNLVLERPVWVNPIKVVEAAVGEDVTLTWEYKYRFSAHAIIFRQRNRTTKNVIQGMGYWYQHNFITDHPVRFNKTSTGEGEIVSLTLMTITEYEVDLVYDCEITLQDGQNIVWNILLEASNETGVFEETTGLSNVTMHQPQQTSHSTTNNWRIMFTSCAILTITAAVIIVVVVIKRRKGQHCCTNNTPGEPSENRVAITYKPNDQNGEMILNE